MSTTTRSVRHREVMGSFTSGSFTPSRQARDGSRIKPAPKPKRTVHLDQAALSRAIRDGVASGFARADVATERAKASAAAASAATTRLSDSMGRLKDAVDAYAESRRLNAGAAQAAAARDAAIAVRSSPASVQAANAARWPRSSR